MSFIIRSLRRHCIVFVAALLAIAAAIPASAGASDEDHQFKLILANPKLAACLSEDPDDPRHAPIVTASVERGELNDTLHLHLRRFKPGLNFDLFTVQRSNKLADGSPDQAFTNFGLAWYQSDVRVNENGNGDVTVKTILLDQIFGFDPDVNLAPTNTFHLGFWFNDPADAQPCGINVVTPFNGEHHAGPLAFITTPDAATGLGPLCVNPDLSKSPVTCNP